MISASAYGHTISVCVNSTLNCCGTRQIEQFHVRRGSGDLSVERADKLLKQLYHNVRKGYKHVLVAADAVGPKGWSGAGGNTSRAENLSLARFCEVNGFEKLAGNYNPNNGHDIHVYVSTIMTPTGKNDTWEAVPVTPEQDFSDDEFRVQPSADIKVLVDAIIRALESK